MGLGACTDEEADDADDTVRKDGLDHESIDTTDELVAVNSLWFCGAASVAAEGKDEVDLRNYT